MPGIQKLHLEDAIEDSPQTRSLLGVFENDANILYKYTTGLYRCFDRVLNAQRELCAATRGLSQQLKAYETQEFPLDSDDSILTDTLFQFSSYLDELSSVHRILAEQLSDGMMHPLAKFLQADLETIRSMQEMLKLASSEHEAATQRYMKLPKKKDNEKLRQEANDDLYVKRKGYHQTALHYYSSLNAVQYKRKCFLIEPMLGYMHGQKAFFSMGNDAICKKEVDDFLSNMNASVQGVHQELGQETQQTVEMIDKIERESIHLYYAEPPTELPPNPPNLSRTQKAGFLYMRSKQALMSAKWERSYFFIQGGNLMCQAKDEVAGSLILDLNEQGTIAEPTDLDDRRFTFQVSSPVNKKAVVLQAENDREKDEWIATINNVVMEEGYVKEKSVKKKERSASGNSQGKTSAALPAPSSREPHKDAGAGRSAPPPTPPSTPSDGGFTPDAPIQFDMISPNDEMKPFKGGNNQGPPSVALPEGATSRRINPFDQSAVDIHSSEGTDNPDFIQTFEVRFLGSMEVKSDRGESLVSETIRQIMAARALHNIFKMTDSNLVVSSQCMRILDPSNNSTRSAFMLQDISFWASHKENKRLFGYITRTRGAGDGSRPTFNCHVFECNTSGDEICHAISTATKLAFQALMERKAMDKKTKEKEILMANISQLDETGHEGYGPQQPRMSADGRFVLLGETDATSADLNPPITKPRGDGDERKVEGAE